MLASLQQVRLRLTQSVLTALSALFRAAAWGAQSVAHSVTDRYLPQAFQRTGMTIVCPITNTSRSHPLHVAVPPEFSLPGSVTVEPIKSVDYAGRKARLIESAPRGFLDDVLSLPDACLYDPAD